MPLTQAQRADVGMLYLNEIRRRIDERRKAHAKLVDDKEPSADVVKAKIGAEKAAARWAARVFRRQAPSTPKIRLDDAYTDGSRIFGAWVAFDGHNVFISDSLLPELGVWREARSAAVNHKQLLCKELAFLQSKALAPAAVAQFQAHTGRLLPLKAGDPVEACRVLINDFLASKRDFVCSI